MYFTAGQIEAWMGIIANAYPECTRTILPNTTHDGKQVSMLRLRAGEGESRHGVLFVGGTHAREWVNPDALLELGADLLFAYDNNASITYGGKEWSATTVKLILETLDVYLLCLNNPDGREYSQTVYNMWRKNRRNNPGFDEGVDINRNLQPLWSGQPGSSCTMSSETYAGPGAFSEPEAKNVRWILDNHDIHCFVDVHSYSQLVLYPWGHAPTQTNDSTERFTALPTAACNDVTPPGYKEYMPPVDLQRFQIIAQRAVDAIAAVNGNVYTPQPGIDLYATTGTHGDYPYSRHVADGRATKTYSFTFETGVVFQPADPKPVKDEAKSGLMAILQNCICAIDLIGTSLFGSSDERQTATSALRKLRDDVLLRTDAGQEWIGLFERNQADLTSLVLEDREAAEVALKLLIGAGEVVDRDVELGRDHVELIQTLAERMTRRTESERQRADMASVVDMAREFTGRSRDDIIEQMLARPPRESGRQSAD